MKNLLLAALLFVGSVNAQGVTPILMSNGVEKWPCDGIMRWGYNVHLTNKMIIKSYLFANLVTTPGYGADIVIHSGEYGGWGTIGDLHMFPHSMGGGRQGELERTFPSDAGIYIGNSQVNLGVICWGGGTIEVYAQIWVK